MTRNFHFTPEVLDKNFNNILTFNFNLEFLLVSGFTTPQFCKAENSTVCKNIILSAFKISLRIFTLLEMAFHKSRNMQEVIK